VSRDQKNQAFVAALLTLSRQSGQLARSTRRVTHPFPEAITLGRLRVDLGGLVEYKAVARCVMKRLSIVLALVLSFVTAAPLRASELPTAKPEQVGLSSERLGRITQVLRADVERGRIPGAVVVVARKGRVAYVQAVGFRHKTAGAPMTPDAIFRIASMTKPIVTVAALSLWEEGRLSLSDPVSKYIPELKNQTVGTGSGRARDDDPGPDAAHLRAHLRQPRDDRDLQDVSGVLQRVLVDADDGRAHRTAEQGAAAQPAWHAVGI
jgi:Beta-lactamase